MTWYDIYSEMNPDAGTNNFIEKITRIVYNCSYTKIFNRKNGKITPWITNYILRLINIKNDLYNQLPKNSNTAINENYTRSGNKKSQDRVLKKTNR